MKNKNSADTNHLEGFLMTLARACRDEFKITFSACIGVMRANHLEMNGMMSNNDDEK
jgi:hypothetical protein